MGEEATRFLPRFHLETKRETEHRIESHQLRDVVAYAVNANPLVPGSTGQRYYHTDQTCAICWNGSTAAGPTDTPLQNPCAPVR